MKPAEDPRGTYLAVLGLESYLLAGGVSTRGSGRILFNTDDTFGREFDTSWEAQRASLVSRCREATDLWGIG